MARKATSDGEPSRGFDDIIGFILLVVALLLLASQFSFDRNDISFLTTEKGPTHNWIGPLGAYLAWSLFLLFGVVAYLMPFVFAAFGAAYLLNFLGHLRERLRRSLLWTLMLMVALTGLLYLMGQAGWFGKWHEKIGASNVGGVLGSLTYGETRNYRIGISLLGRPGATIVYTTLLLISVLFLTRFQLGDWIRGLIGKESAAAPDPEEVQLERKARDLQKQAKKLEEEVERERSGLGPDMKPVPEPTVRDLSVPQKSSRSKKIVLPGAPRELKKIEEPAPPDVVEVIPAREILAATSADVLGKTAEPSTKSADAKTDEATPGKPSDPKPEPTVHIADGTVPVPAPKPKPAPKKPKPITVASTPLIGNYQLPPMDFLQMPDLNLRPTESKEELMANARLMQQTLAQFDIEVSLGDITKGPTITRYELHPAPGVKLEKITALNNNIAAALKAERILILAPVPGKSSVGVEVPITLPFKV